MSQPESPRPAKLSPLNIQAEAATVRETDDVYRVYRPEWVIVCVFGVPAEGAALEQAHRYFQENYAGRVHPEHARFEHVGAGPHAVVYLQLKLPTLKGEFKYAFLAQRHAEKQGWSDWSIVARNSKADHELRSYGVKRLAS